MRHVIEQYHCDDYRLLVLMHEIEESKKKPTPWWVPGAWVLGIGTVVLLLAAWVWR